MFRFSTTLILSWHLVVGEIVVGLVNVDVSMYVIVPRSNYNSSVNTATQLFEETYVNASWKPLPGQLQLELEFVSPSVKSPFSTKRYFILEQ